MSEPQKVASGGFRIDRRRALAKLQEYQLPEPARFVLPWLRCAYASGAKAASLSSGLDWVQLAFNGRPLAEKFVKEPFDAIFSEDEDCPRHRDLAVGLLTAFRLEPALVTLVSGPAGKQVKLVARSIEDSQVEESALPHEGTVVTVSWRGSGSGAENISEVLSQAQQRSGMLSFPLQINGAPATPESASLEPSVALELDGIRVRLAVPSDPLDPKSEAGLYKHGVLVETMRFEGLQLAVRAEMNHDGWSLDASQTGVVMTEEERKSLLARLQPSLSALIAKAAELQRRFPELAARCLFGDGADGLRKRAARRALGPRPWRAWAGRGPELEEFLLMERRGTRWLRAAASRLLGHLELDAADPAKAALWEAPLYLSLTGKGLSLAALKRQAKSHGVVPVAKEIPNLIPPGLDIVWLPGGPDPCLDALFGPRVKLMDDLLRSAEQAPPPDPSAPLG